MWTAILLIGALISPFHSEFQKGPHPYPTEQACKTDMAKGIKLVTDQLVAKIGKDKVFIVGRCVQNFQEPRPDPDGEPLPESQEKQAPTGPTPPSAKPEAPGSDDSGKNFR